MMNTKLDDGTNHLSHWSHSGWSLSLGQEVRYIGSATGHHLVKVFRLRIDRPRGVRCRDTSFLGGSIGSLNGRVLTHPVTRRMRRRVSISFCRRAASFSLSSSRISCIADQWEELKIYRLVRDTPYCFVLIQFCKNRNVTSITRIGQLLLSALLCWWKTPVL